MGLNEKYTLVPPEEAPFFRAGRAGCWFVLAVALLGFAGFLLKAPSAAGVFPKGIPMAPATALCFMLLAGSLLMRQSRHPRWRHALMTAVILVVAVSAAELLFQPQAGQGGAIPLWKMSPITSGLFFLSAFSLHRLTRLKPGPDFAALAAGAGLFALSFLILLGYLYGSPFFYGGTIIPVAFSTGMAFCALSMSLLSSDPASLQATPFFGDSLKAVLFRNFLPLIVAVILLDEVIDLGATPTANVFSALAAMAVAAWVGKRVAAGVGDQVASARKRQEESESRLEASQALLQSVIDNTPALVYTLDPEGRFIFANKSLSELFGLPPSAFIGKKREEVMPAETAAQHTENDRLVLKSGAAQQFEEKGAFRDGVETTYLTTKFPLRSGRGEITGLGGVSTDITGRKLAEREREEMQSLLRQSQKMESVGRLAGGVAHDFNNLLTSIIGYSGMLLKSLPPGDPGREDVKEILASADRAAGLTRQLLAFSRKQVINPRALDLNSSVGGMVKMLKRLIGEDIRIETRLAPRECPVKIDTGQLDQVLVNLAVNAADAMPKGGTLVLATEPVSPEESFFLRHPDLPRGPLICLSVSDTGSGMTDQVKEHLFEPFFTTKEKGKGTGLGLSTVFGIVKQSGGEIEAESELGRGTTFRIYLPHSQAAVLPGANEKEKAAETLVKGTETVLLAEDEDSLRRFEERLLRSLGYTVIAAADGKEALEAAERQGKPVDLLLTDVVMPGINGKELAAELARRKLAARTLYMSGYTDDAILEHGVLEEGIAFIYKPFTAEALSLKMREVLDGPADKARA